MFTVFRTQVPPDNFFPALCGATLSMPQRLLAKLGIARLDAFGEKLVFAAEMFVKAANREADAFITVRRRAHSSPPPKSTSSVLQDTL